MITVALKKPEIQKQGRPLRILVDLDGVICRYDFPMIVKNFFGVDLLSKDIFAHDLADVLGVPPKQIDEMFLEQVWGKPNFIEGAIETLQEWEGKYEIDIFSNRVKYMGAAGLQTWLEENGVPFDYIENTGDNQYYDFHIDDSPAKLMSTNSEVKLLFSQPWNLKCLNILGALKRVMDWQEIGQEIG